MPERDPIKLLHDAWSELNSPAETPPLQDENSETRETVDWMQQAWSQIDVPQAQLPQRVRIWRFPIFTTSIAAALLLSAFIFMLQSNTKKEEIATPSIVVAAPMRTEKPKLLANDNEKMQVLAGKVRLTMLKHPSNSNLHETDS